MKQKKQPAEKKPLSKGAQIACGVIAAIIIIPIVVSLGGKKSESSSDSSIHRAQLKCALMEEADRVNVMGEPLDDTTKKKAEDFCYSQWDKRISPESTEEKFIEVVEVDWEVRKTEKLDGRTLESYLNEAQD